MENIYSLSEVIRQKIANVELHSKLCKDYAEQKAVFEALQRRRPVKSNQVALLNELFKAREELYRREKMAWGSDCPIESLYAHFGAVCRASNGEIVSTYTIDQNNDIRALKSLLKKETAEVL